jgi:general secretion pathway protein I
MDTRRLSRNAPARSCAALRHRASRRAGFTLLEVLVALAIVAVALTASMRGAMTLTNNSRDVDRKLYAVLTAQNQLLEVRFIGGQAAPGDSEFECSQGGVQFHCRQTISTTPNPFFRRVEVHVSSEGDDAREYADLMALLPITTAAAAAN